jgi:signal transduction histidine kinase
MRRMSDPTDPDRRAESAVDSPPRDAVGSVSVRTMRVRNGIALAVLGLLSIGSYLLVRRSLADQESAAEVLRAANHQRFLAERMIVLSMRLANHYDAVATRQKLVQIEQDADELERSHDSLMSGEATAAIGDTVSPEVRRIYGERPIHLDKTIRGFLAAVRKLVRSSEEQEKLDWMVPQLDYLADVTSTPILEDLSNGFDALVQQFQRESDERMRSTQRLEALLLGSTVLVLVVVGLFVFRPMVLHVRQDIEELRDRAEALERSNSELEQFAYVASHDLQEPLRMIAAYVQLLDRRYKGKLGPDADECIHFASEGATRMHRLILDLLAFSRVGTHGGGMISTDLGHALQGVLDDMQVAIEESGARIRSNGLPHVRADPLQAGQLLQNLVANAIKFRGSGQPEIRIDASREGDLWHVSVRDNGIGFDMRFAERIFVIFQRLHARDRYPGTGIGLAICKKIVERHGGRIWAESAPGEGSTFHFTLPAADPTSS